MSQITPSPRPRVVLLTSPNVYGAEIINRFAAESGIELVGVGLTDRVYKGKGLLATARTIIRRTGWNYTLYNVLAGNVAWPILSLSGRPKGLKTLKGNVRALKDVNDEACLSWLRELQPDYVASYYFNQWIGAGVRAIPAQGCINMHPSLLPALRGPDPLFRTLERGLTTSGITIHVVEDNFDAGQILHQESHDVPAGISLFGLYLLRVRQGAEIFSQWLAGQITASATVPPPESGLSDDYSTFPKPDEVAKFLKSGRALISLGELSRAIREIE